MMSMNNYDELCKKILNEGVKKIDRTGVGTLSIFGYQMRFNLSDGFPLLTTKKVHYKSILHELLWFIKGDTNIKYLVDNDVKIWNEWPYEAYRKSKFYQNETLNEFIDKIKYDSQFADEHGNLGPVYGEQWRNFGGVDQLKEVIKLLKNNPDSRRIIVSGWNPPLLNEMALPPCHAFFQFYVAGNKLSLQLYQRSADVFLGVPFNIASYATLLIMVAQVCNFEPFEFIHTLGDAHLYLNHLEQIKLQLSRPHKNLPKLTLNQEVKDLFSFKFDDFRLDDYNPHKAIKGKVAV